MNAEDVISLIKSYKKETDKKIEEAADKFVNDVIAQIQDFYENDKTKWMILSMNSKIGININNIDPSFEKIDFEMCSWYFFQNEEPIESHDWKVFETHLKDNEFQSVCGYKDMYEICAVILPFVKALERRGFKFYTTDEENCQLIVCFEV